jgi:RNA polymerase sigma-70 factor (ECF subfamily)
MVRSELPVPVGLPAIDPLAELVRAVQAGDRRATNQLLRAITPALLRVARQILGAEHPELRDVVQEAAFGVLTALPRFRGECSVLHFSCRVAVLAGMNVRRRELSHASKAHRLAQMASVLPDWGDADTPERALASERCVSAVRELLGTLPEAQAEVLGLHYAVGLTVDEIAATTAAPVETVRSRLKLGRRALRGRVLRDRRLADLVDAKHGNAR